MRYSKTLDLVVTTLFGGAPHAILMLSIGCAKYGQENGPFGPAAVELELQGNWHARQSRRLDLLTREAEAEGKAHGKHPRLDATHTDPAPRGPYR